MESGAKDGPDRGWSWVVAFVACFNSLILAGIFRTSGVLFVAFIDEFGVTREEAAWPVVLCISVLNLTGPFSGILSQRYGVRPVTMAGAVIAATGISACYFTTSLKVITFLFGIVFGIGYGLISTLMPVIVNVYFLNLRATANGIANAGSCFGSVILPIFFEYLISAYGLSGCFLMTGGVVLHITIAGALLRPPSWLKKPKHSGRNKACLESLSNTEKKKKDDNDHDCNLKESIKNGELVTGDNAKVLVGNMNVSGYQNFYPDRSSVHHRNLHSELVDTLKQKSNIHKSDDRIFKGDIFLNKTHTVVERAGDRKSIDELQKSLNDFEESLKEFENVTGDQHFTNQNSVSNDEVVVSKSSHSPVDTCCVRDHGLHLYHSDGIINPECEQTENTSSCDRSDEMKKSKERLITGNNSPNFDRCTNSAKALPALNGSEIQETNSDVDKQIGQADNNISTNVGKNAFLSTFESFATVLSSPMFYVTSMTNVSFYFLFHMYVVIIVDYAHDRGVLENDSKYIIFAFSMSDLAGRLCLGWVTDRKYIRRSHFVMGCMAGIGLIFFCFPFATAYGSLIAVSCCYGLLLGCTMVVFPILLVDFLGTELHPVAFGCMCFMNGFASFSRPFLIGYFRDSVGGSYANMFYILGAISLTASMFWLLENFFVKKKPPSTDQSV